MTLSKTGAVLRLWALALALSAALVAAGERWPEPLVPAGGAIAALLLGPPLLMTLWLLRRWRLQSGDPDRGESSD
jgi:hypothetical protein